MRIQRAEREHSDRLRTWIGGRKIVNFRQPLTSMNVLFFSRRFLDENFWSRFRIFIGEQFVCWTENRWTQWLLWSTRYWPCRCRWWWKRSCFLLDESPFWRYKSRFVQVFSLWIYIKHSLDNSKTYQWTPCRPIECAHANTIFIADPWYESQNEFEKVQKQEWTFDGYGYGDETVLDITAVTSQCIGKGEVFTGSGRGVAFITRIQIQACRFLRCSTEIRYQAFEMSSLFLPFELENRHDSTRSHSTLSNRTRPQQG